jgi:hypothetical protein
VALAPPPTIQNHAILAKTHFTHAGSGRVSLVTTAHFDDTPAGAIEAANDILGVWVGLVGAFGNQVTIGPVDVLIGDGTDVPDEATSTGAKGTGTVTDPIVPSNVALLVKKTNGRGGKKNRGRMYLPWALAENKVDELGNIDATILAGLQTAFTAMVTSLAAADVTLAIANKTLVVGGDGKKHVTHIGLAVQPVTQLTVEGVVATQRRRLGR